MNDERFIINKYVPLHVLSGNKFTNQRGKGSWYAYSNYRKKWDKALKVCLPSPKVEPPEYVHGQIIRVYGDRKREFDLPNYAHGCKPIPDYLRDSGWIIDDNPKHWHCDYYQISWKGGENLKPGTIIRIFKQSTMEKKVCDLLKF